MKKYLVVVLLLANAVSYGQEAPKEVEQTIKFGGFVKNDMFYDTRQVVSAREGHFLLYPTNVSKDSAGIDKNAKGSLNMLAFQTRLNAKISGPDAFGAKSSGLVEGAFFGHSNGDENGFRLRHAYGKLNWENTEFLFGQTWHPMFVTGCFPGTVSFSTGVPFQPFSRNPQLRLTQSVGDLKIMLAALSQRDFTSINADKTANSTALRNSSMPDMQFQLHYGSDNKEAGTDYLVGAGAGYKTLVPQIVTTTEYATDESISSYSTMAFANVKLKPITIKLEAVYGQNMTDLLMLGGYAVSDSSAETHTNGDLKGFVTYTNLNTMSTWLDIHTNGKKIQGGIFVGYTQNLGADADVRGQVTARSSNIDYVYRISPRILFNSGKMRFAVEPDYTVAAYATKQDSKLKSTESDEVSNLRFLFSAYYFF